MLSQCELVSEYITLSIKRYYGYELKIVLLYMTYHYDPNFYVNFTKWRSNKRSEIPTQDNVLRTYKLSLRKLKGTGSFVSIA